MRLIGATDMGGHALLINADQINAVRQLSHGGSRIDLRNGAFL